MGLSQSTIKADKEQRAREADQEAEYQEAQRIKKIKENIILQQHTDKLNYDIAKRNRNARGGCARSDPIGTYIGVLIFLILIVIIIVALMVPCGMNHGKPTLIVGRGHNDGRPRRIRYLF